MEKKLDIKHMLVHANRLFIIASNNRIWWSADGDFTSWWKTPETDGYGPNQDAGWCDIPGDISMVGTKGEQLIVCTPDGNYVLTGFTTFTFNLEKIKEHEGYV